MTSTGNKKPKKTFKCHSKDKVCNGIVLAGQGLYCDDCKGLRPVPSYENAVTLLPIAEIKNKNQYLGHCLIKGKYDINYVITLLRIIMDQCYAMRLNPRDLQFTLWTSTQKLLAMLEVERDQLFK